MKQTTSFLALAAACSIVLAGCAPIAESVDSVLGALSGRPAPLPPGILEVDAPYGTSARDFCFAKDSPAFDSLANANAIRSAAAAAGKDAPMEGAPALRLRLFAPGEDGRFLVGDNLEFRVTPKSLIQPFTSVGRPYAVGDRTFVRYLAAGPGETLSVDVAAPASLELVVSTTEGRSGCFQVEVTRSH